MIKISFYYKNDFLYAFKIIGHGPEYICSAVSVLVINTVNCIEKFTQDKFICDYNKNGGLFYFKFNDFISHDSKVLIDALEFGLKNISFEYNKFVKISEVKV